MPAYTSFRLNRIAAVCVWAVWHNGDNLTP
jgi:hypothetical protein